MTVIKDRLTESSLFYLFGHESKDKYQFSHYFDDHFGHRKSRPLDLCINHDVSEETLNAFKDFHEGVVAFPHRLGRLVILECQMSQGSGRIRTDIKTPIPEKIADAKGENYRQQH